MLFRSLPGVDDDVINSRLLGRQVNAIEWMIPLQAHIMLTDSSEWTVEPSVNGLFTPNSFRNKQQTYYGSSGLVEPVIVGESAIFTLRFGSSVRSMSYDDVNGKTGTDLSIMASHLFEDRSIIDCTYQQHPNSIVWFVLSDGALLSFTHHKEHDVWAWARHKTDGLYESICCIPGDTQDDVYTIVNRTINGVVKRFTEVMATRNVNNFFGVDCGATREGSPSITVSGLDHLEGKTVEIVADGILVKGKVVTGGSVTLNNPASLVHVGLPYTWRLKTLQVDASSKNVGYSADKKKLIQGATISVINSAGGQAGQDQFVNLNYPIGTKGLYSGDLDVNLLARWERDGKFEINGTGTLPMHIINIMPRVSIGG